MTRNFFRPAALGVSIALMAVAGQAVAQPPAAPPAAPRGAHAGMMQRDPAEMMKRHADKLRAVLQLTPAQEPALQAFLKAMAPPADMMQRMKGEHEAMAKLTTPQRLDRMEAMRKEHEAKMDARIAATRAFYAQLTPAQQKAFDALPPMGGHGMKMMRHHRMMGGHEGGQKGGHGGHGGR